MLLDDINSIDVHASVSRDSSHVYVQYVRARCMRRSALYVRQMYSDVCDVHAMCTLARREILWRRAQRAEYILLSKRNIEIYLLLNIY